MARLMSISQHCSELAFALAAIGEPRSFISTSQWLETASGIRSIRFDLTRYDPGAAWCSTAYDHLVEREKQLARFTKDLAVFLFIWAGLEALIDELSLSDLTAPAGKINQACGYITSNESRAVTPVRYAEELSRLRDCISQLPGREDLVDRFKLLPHVGFQALGLFLVYRIRNKFAHGSAVFCQKDVEDSVSDYNLFRHASRVVLLSIQMIVSVLCADDEEMVVLWREVIEGQSYHVRDLLRSLHVVGTDRQEGQVSLFGDRDS